MVRKLRVGAAQIGGIGLEEPREQVVERHIALLEEAAKRKVELIVYPECSLTTYFPRLVLQESEINKFFEKTMPNPSVQPLFDKARELGIAFSLGYSELEYGKRYNSSILVGKDGKIIGKYRKSHIGGTYEPVSGRESQYMERRYFLPGNTGFKVWSAFGGKIGMGICYDRRFSEFWRVMGMKGENNMVRKKQELHHCATCGEVSTEKGHLCAPVVGDQLVICEYCGELVGDPRHVCAPKVLDFRFVCTGCGRVTSDEDLVCQPAEILVKKSAGPKRKTPVKTAARKKPARKTTAKKPAAKKATARKTATKRTATAKTSTRKTAVKKSAPGKTAAKKSTVRKSPARKTAARKSTARKKK